MFCYLSVTGYLWQPAIASIHRFLPHTCRTFLPHMRTAYLLYTDGVQHHAAGQYIPATTQFIICSTRKNPVLPIKTPPCCLSRLASCNSIQFKTSATHTYNSLYMRFCSLYYCLIISKKKNQQAHSTGCSVNQLAIQTPH